jgi:hypothetical protein
MTKVHRDQEFSDPDRTLRGTSLTDTDSRSGHMSLKQRSPNNQVITASYSNSEPDLTVIYSGLFFDSAKHISLRQHR